MSLKKVGCKIFFRPLSWTQITTILTRQNYFHKKILKLFLFRSSMGWNQTSRPHELSQTSCNNPELQSLAANQTNASIWFGAVCNFRKTGRQFGRKGQFCDAISTQLNFIMARNNNPSIPLTGNYFLPPNVLAFSNNENDRSFKRWNSSNSFKTHKTKTEKAETIWYIIKINLPLCHKIRTSAHQYSPLLQKKSNKSLKA